MFICDIKTARFYYTVFVLLCAKWLLTMLEGISRDVSALCFLKLFSDINGKRFNYVNGNLATICVHVSLCLSAATAYRTFSIPNVSWYALCVLAFLAFLLHLS